MTIKNTVERQKAADFHKKLKRHKKQTKQMYHYGIYSKSEYKKLQSIISSKIDEVWSGMVEYDMGLIGLN